jgi:hypothetical protein
MNNNGGGGRMIIRATGAGGVGGVPAPTTVTDLEDQNTSFLAHMNGTDGSTAFVDSSVNKISITSINGTTISTSQSKFGGASGQFTGSSCLTATSNSTFAFGTGDFTMECWVYPTNANYGNGGYIDYTGTLLDTRSSGGSSNGALIIFSNTGKIRLFSGGLILESTSTVSLNQWSHIALVRSSGTCTFYINGVASGLAPFTNNCSDTSFTVGAPVDHVNTDSSLKHIGYMDEVRISKGLARYTNDFTPPASAFTADAYDSLLLHGDGSDGSTSFTDSSQSPSTVVSQNGASISTSQSKFGGASILLNRASSQRLTVIDPTKFTFGTDDFTIETWVYLNSMPTALNYPDGFYICGWGEDNSVFGVDYLIGPTNIAFNPVYYGNYQINVAHGMNVHEWHHIALCRNNGTFMLFIDGVLKQAAHSGDSVYAPAGSTNQSAITIGAGEPFASTGGDFDGYMDEFRISKGIARYTTNNFTPPNAEFYAADPTKLPSSPQVGQVVYADSGKTIAYICTNATGPVWTRFAA